MPVRACVCVCVSDARNEEGYGACYIYFVGKIAWASSRISKKSLRRYIHKHVPVDSCRGRWEQKSERNDNTTGVPLLPPSLPTPLRQVRSAVVTEKKVGEGGDGVFWAHADDFGERRRQTREDVLHEVGLHR